MQYTHDFITRNADRALKRLDTDYIDIYLLHARDGVDARLKLGGPDRVEAFMRRYKDGAQTPPEEIVDTMDALVQAGKIRYWGVSGRNTEEMAEFLQACESTGKSPISCLQNGYNLADRERETEDLFPLLSRTGIGVQSIGPHAAGLLAPGRTAEPGSALADLLNALDRVAGDLGVPRSQVCVAWVLSHPELTTALAAAESPEHVDDNLAGSTLDLPAEAIAALNTASDAYRQRQEAEGKGRAR
jgi:aryl-alcohol dehydrogenase-like predicted oxidoreductase